jgi:iron complex outermembrane receptor protein
MTSTNRLGSRTVLQTLILSLVLALFANPTWAQDDQGEEADNDTEQTEEEAVALDRVQVTGSLLKREDFTSTSPVQIVNAETQAQVGQLEMADILQNTTIASGTTQLANQWNGFVVQGGTGIQSLDLRGLGDSRTLVLLNGRRPGGSGTKGQTFALDLAMLPEIAVQRAEFVLDGSSSIYGSDAVAGVANVITRRSVDGFEVQAIADLPQESGGEMYRVGFITGWNFDKGNMTFSAQYQKREALTIGDRDYLSCPQDLFYDEDGNRIDRYDGSLHGSPNDWGHGYGCDNLYADTILDHWDGGRLIPSPDGVTEGPLEGYRYRNPVRWDDDAGHPYYESRTDFPFTKSEQVINEMERLNVYATFDYTFDFWGGVDMDADFLYSSRETNAENWRQFFPIIGSGWLCPSTFCYDDDPSWVPEIFLPLGQPVMPYPSNYGADIDYYYFTAGFEGLLPTDSYWSWQVYGSYSYSDGDYWNNAILTSRSGDWGEGVEAPPPIDFYDPAILSGQNMQALVDAIGVDIRGNTVYDQLQVVGILSGDLFQMPAGTVGAAFGLEWREFGIDDNPDQRSQDGEIWNSTRALVTKGTNSVWEAFAEFEVPLLAGKPGVEELTLNVSARTFDYDEGGSDSVWKAGLRWALTPTFMFRSTMGTSYRAPALYELFLGDETGFAGQGMDPCIDWGESTNELIRRNCAADGIPDDYDGLGSSAEVTSGGGAGNLEPETSDAMTFGFVWTPEFSDLSVAVDYVEIEVNDQIDDLGASAILSGCYSAENFPNSFCDLFTRASADAVPFPYNILTVEDTFLNVNQQRYEGIDLNLLWNMDLSFGQLELAAQSTWNLENVQQLFAPGEVEGFDTTDYVGTIGSPDNTTNFRATLNWQDWRFNYYLQYVSETDDRLYGDTETTYFGYDPAYRDLTMDSVIYHNLSVIYQQDNWDVLVGINNLFDEEPDLYSSAFRSMRGNFPISASQYDVIGRSFFLRFNWRK